jgi:hypothetical protein
MIREEKNGESLAIPVAVDGSNFGKTIFRKYKGFISDLKNKIKIGLSRNFFLPLSLKTTPNNRSSPNIGPIKIFFSKILIFKHN